MHFELGEHLRHSLQASGTSKRSQIPPKSKIKNKKNQYTAVYCSILV